MNMKRNIVGVGMLLLFAAVLWSCSDSSDNNPEQDLSLEQSLVAKTNTLSGAVTDISNSNGFDIITMDDSSSTKSGEEGEENDDPRFSLSITLDDIKGLYDYTPSVNEETSETKFGHQKVFEKTKDTTLFILRLPKEKATNPWALYSNEEGDAELTNDFVITTTEYNYAYAGGFKFDYLLNSEIAVEGEPAGALYVDWSISENLHFDYMSKYSFTDNYSVGVEFQFGDMISYQYHLDEGEDVLFKEKVEIVKVEGSDSKELEYTLAIGNIEIVKNSQSEGYQVYRDGVLEEGAVVEVVTETGETDEAAVVFCRKGLDLKITFADESTVVLSELLGEGTLDKMNEIFSSMYDMNFVKHLVDKVAREVYYTNQNSATETE